MSLHNIIEGSFICPNCKAGYDEGFLIDLGDQVMASLNPGDVLPWSKGDRPTGNWQCEGVGVCSKCLNYLVATVEFADLTFFKVIDLQVELANRDSH